MSIKFVFMKNISTFVSEKGYDLNRIIGINVYDTYNEYNSALGEALLDGFESIKYFPVDLSFEDKISYISPSLSHLKHLFAFVTICYRYVPVGIQIIVLLHWEMPPNLFTINQLKIKNYGKSKINSLRRLQERTDNEEMDALF